jgi:DNA ligase-1
MKYSKLTETYERISATTKRLEKTDILSELLKHIKDDEKEILYLLEGSVFPRSDERKIGISTQLVIKSLSKSTGESPKEITKMWKSIGDLGEVAEKICDRKKQSTLSHKELTTEKVIANIRKLSEFEGKGTVDKKISLIAELLSSASGSEAKYLMRTLIGDLRIGIKESTIRDSLALTFFPEEKELAKSKIEEALEKTNDSAKVFLLAKKGLKALAGIEIEIGKPMKVMLAQKASDIKEGFDIVGKPAALEYKYDGFRLLISKKGEDISLFTRRLENVSKQFPEVVEYVKTDIKAKDVIIDGEAIGYNAKTKEYLPFQNISQRIKRKYDIEKMRKDFPVELNLFDIIYIDGKDLLNEPFKKRSEILRKIIHSEKYKIVPAKQIITDDEKEAEKFYNEALKMNQEGIMMKNLDAPYKPGSRVGHMIKIKPNTRDLDLVIVGGEWGTGKRAGWLSSFILACRDKNEFLTIGKMGTGIKEKESEEEDSITFKELTKQLKPYIIEEHGREVKIKPKIVVTIIYQEIQKSPTYTSGFALRFPRFIALRPDRSPEDIATSKEVEKEYKKQSSK